jgi:DNA-directed RNA polymerase specialized sigma24 family protein
MHPQLKGALTHPGYRKIIARAAIHADTTIRKYIWRGHRRKFNEAGEIMVGDKTASDFVSEAILRLIDGRRTFDPSRTLLENLNSITDSLISSEKKHSDRTGIVDYLETTGEEESGATDPITSKATTEPPPDMQLRQKEILEDQRRCIESIVASFDGDPDMQEYIKTLGAGFKRSEIAELMEIPGEKVDELRRKLIKYSPKFFGVDSFAELDQRLRKGA